MINRECHDIPPQLCPHCGYMAEVASNITRGDTNKPRPGDLYMCLACGSFLQFGPALQCERLPKETIAALRPEEKMQLFEMRVAWAMLSEETKRKMRERGGKA